MSQLNLVETSSETAEVIKDWQYFVEIGDSHSLPDDEEEQKLFNGLFISFLQKNTRIDSRQRLEQMRSVQNVDDLLEVIEIPELASRNSATEDTIKKRISNAGGKN